MENRGKLSFALSVLLALCAVVAVLALLLNIAGTSQSMMLGLMRRHTDPAMTGLPAEHYEGVTEMITGYLAGQTEEFQYVLPGADGVEYLCFNAHEQAHMADCRALFALDRRVLTISAALCAVLAAWINAMKQRRAMLAGLSAGFCGSLLLLAALGIWAVVDFDSLFILFHRTFFTNDLWLMDYHRDLIIRLMPIELFMDYAGFLLITWAGLQLGGAILCGFAAVRMGRKRQDEPADEA